MGNVSFKRSSVLTPWDPPEGSPRMLAVHPPAGTLQRPLSLLRDTLCSLDTKAAKLHSSRVFVPTHPFEPFLQPVAGSPSSGL